MKHTVIGMLAHVDAGKTTLSEALLYCAGATRTLGRVDHKDAFLDIFALERERGITIFSKQAIFTQGDTTFTLLDTPGHADFSAEMERTLSVLDCAILVISAPAGVQSHTLTVWKLLRERKIPTLLFLNKTDLPSPDRAELIARLRRELGEGIFDYAAPDSENLALCDEELCEEYLAQEALSQQSICAAVHRAKLFPCFFGSALKLEGVEDFLQALSVLAPVAPVRDNFSAKVFKITHDAQGVRLTHLRLTGGSLRVRDTVSGEGWADKVTQLRLYSGAKFSSVEQISCGEIAAVAGLEHTAAGMGLGAETQEETPTLEPVFTYNILLPEGCDVQSALSDLRRLEEEDPLLHLVWDERTRSLQAQLMGKIQQEILRRLVWERFGLAIDFGPGEILYRETIAAAVEGVGHFEPLRHYAEVHLLLEPGKRGSGLRFFADCAADELDRNWQRLILTHLAEKQHLGVLTGAPITDMKLTLVAGKAHAKHTEGGDFRQATYRAVRQGLMRAESILLEPWYRFRMELPHSTLGRAMTDLQRMGAELADTEAQEDFTVLRGKVPVAAFGEYAAEVAAYTRGAGRVTTVSCGYAPCAEQEKRVAEIGYSAEADTENPADSIFCVNGAGHPVKWSEVFSHMHLPPVLEKAKEEPLPVQAARYVERAVADKELMAIFERTYGPIRDRARALRPTEKSSAKPYHAKPQPEGPEYVLVDGYNIIFAWDELRELAADSLDTARTRLIEILRNYQGFRQCPVILVFDAYRVKGNPGSTEKHGGVTVVYTKEAQTADTYIEKAAYDLSKKHRVRVATSDGMEQLIILGSGALRVPASAFEAEVREILAAIQTVIRNLK